MFLGHMTLTVTQMTSVGEASKNGTPTQGNVNVGALFMIVKVTRA